MNRYRKALCWRTPITAFWALLAAMSGCGDRGDSSLSAPTSAAAPIPSAVPSATISGSVGGPVEPRTGPLVGSWRGSFESKKATVELDPGVKEPSWSKDDGKARASKGEIEVHVSPDGTITGSLRGALGDATLAGAADGEQLALSFAPKEQSSDAISGVIALRLSGGQLTGELKGASADATLVRTAKLALNRATP